MAPRPRIVATDEERGKKDDDRKPAKANSWHAGRRSWRKRRVVGLALVSALIWLLFYYKAPIVEWRDRVKSTYTSMARTSRSRDEGSHAPDPNNGPQAPRGTPAKAPGAGSSDVATHDYNGPVKFYNLASSLHGIARTMGHRIRNRNVLFAASDLKSVAAIIPLACEMARWNRNFVHIAIMGSDDMTMEEIQKINGVDKLSCDVYWHDARPDYASYSTDKRMEASVAGALSHMENFMHPQAIIVAEPVHENAFFVRGIRSKSTELKQALIEVPQDDPNRLSWITRLDAKALSSWHSATIDIIMQALPESSGSMIRLLQSLETADYAGSIPPRLTIELPHKVDLATQNFLKSFNWPPAGYQSSHAPINQLVLRRRIPEHQISVDDAAIRFIESFYPSSLQGPHVLLLSPQAQLSPVFFHFLKLHVLEYKHSTLAPEDSEHLLGISLESPSMYLNGSTSFQPPASADSSHKATSVKDDDTKSKIDDEDDVLAPFLWQAPNSNAALYFGDKWMELHSFLTKRHAANKHPLTKSHHRNRQKFISEKFPAWTEYLLDLMQTRGYSLLYPSRPSSRSQSSSTTQSLVIVHNELYHPPEEFSHPPPAEHASPPHLPDDSILTVDDLEPSAFNSLSSISNKLNFELPLLHNLLSLLHPFPTMSHDDGDQKRSPILRAIPPPAPMPPLLSLPLLDHLGDHIVQHDLQRRAEHAAVNYRRDAGGCSEERSQKEGKVVPGSADDLFCLNDDQYEYEDDGNEDDIKDNMSRGGQQRADPKEEGDKVEEVEEKEPVRPVHKPKQATSSKTLVAATNTATSRLKHKTTSPKSAKDQTSFAPTTTTRRMAATTTTRLFHGGHGGGDVASVVNAIVDPAGYAATARAGFGKKLKDESIVEAAPIIRYKDYELTDAEKEELAAYNARMMVAGPEEEGQNDPGDEMNDDGETESGQTGRGTRAKSSASDHQSPGEDEDDEATTRTRMREAGRESADKPTKAAAFHHGHGGDGAASVVHAVVDPDAYAATARAGWKTKHKQAEQDNRRNKDAEAAADKGNEASEPIPTVDSEPAPTLQADGPSTVRTDADDLDEDSKPTPTSTPKSAPPLQRVAQPRRAAGKVGHLRGWDEGGLEEDDETAAAADALITANDPKARNERAQAEKAEDEEQGKVVGKGTIRVGQGDREKEGVDVIDEEDEEIVLARQKAHESKLAEGQEGGLGVGLVGRSGDREPRLGRVGGRIGRMRVEDDAGDG